MKKIKIKVEDIFYFENGIIKIVGLEEKTKKLNRSVRSENMN